MKNISKIITISLVSSTFLLAGSNKSIHDIFDNRLKGKSNGGTVNDAASSEDGLGLIALTPPSGGTSELQNELQTQKAMRETLKEEKNPENRKNIREAILANRISDEIKSSAKFSKRLSKLKNVGMHFEYQAGTLSSCYDIKKSFPLSKSGEYQLSDGFLAKCDMSSTGVELYNNNLNSCSEIESRINIKTTSIFTLNNGSQVKCDSNGNELYNNNLNSCAEINSKYNITTIGNYVLLNGSTVTCNTDGTVYNPYSGLVNKYVGYLGKTNYGVVSKNITIPKGTRKVSVKIYYAGDFNSSSEYANTYINNSYVGKTGGKGSHTGYVTFTSNVPTSATSFALKFNALSSVNYRPSSSNTPYGYWQYYKIWVTTYK